MDDTQLRTLIAVSESGSISKASERLHIAPSALSRQIRFLESELNLQLFERHGRGMVVTEAGKAVVDRSRRVTAEMDGIKQFAAESSTTPAGNVTLGMPPSVAEMMAAPIVSALWESYPEIHLRIVTAFTGHLRDWVQSGDVDIAVLYDPLHTSALRSTPLLTEELLLVGPSSCELSLTRPVPFSTLTGEQLILPSPQHGLRAVLNIYAAKSRLHLSTRVEADSYSTIIALVLAGLGRTVLPLSPIHKLIDAGQLRAAPLADPSPNRRLVLSLANERPPTRAMRVVTDTILETVHALVESKIWHAQINRDLSTAGHRLSP